MKIKLLLACGLTLALAACSEQHKVETTPAPAPVVTQQTVTPAVKSDSTASVKPMAMLPISTKPMPNWATQQNKTVAPVGTMKMGVETFDVISACKPHDCGSDFMYTMTNNANEQSFSLVVHVKDVTGAITEPSKYASYWYMGNPDTQTKVFLQNLLKSDPNWK